MSGRKTRPLPDNLPSVSSSQSESEAPTRQRLLAIAASLFREQGYDRTRTRELSEHLGIQSASLYYHINNKEDLLYDICLAGIQEISAAVEKAAADDRKPVDQLKAVIAAHVLTALAAPDVHATMLLELKSLSKDRRQAIVTRRDEYERLIQGVLERCQDAGVVRTDIAARHLTLALLNLLNWTIFWFRPEGELGPDRIAEMLSTVFIDGAISAKAPTRKRRAPAGLNSGA